MPAVNFGAWLPDLAAISPEPITRDAKNVRPRTGHYGPFPGLTATTDALTGACRGAVAARDKDNAAHMYAGDATKLYELETATWTDRTRSSGGAYTLGETDYWRFATYGDRLIATNGVDAPQYIDMSTAATNFAALGGSPGAAKYIATYGEFIFLGALASSQKAIKWSGIGSSTSWTAGVGQSDEQEFADGGVITGLVATKAALYVFQEKCIRRVVYVGGDVIMQIDKIIDGIGCIAPGSLISYGQLMFFLSEDGFYQFDGETQPQPIGHGRFNNWFQDDSQRTYWYKMSAAIDPKNKLFVLGYASTNSASPDSLLLYDYTTGWASYVRQAHEYLIGAQSTFTSIDDLLGNLDTDYNISFDDPFYAGGAFYFAAFNSAHKLASFSGDNLEATLTVGVVSLLDGMRATVEWLKPIADTTTATCAGGYQVRPGDTITYASAVSQQTSGRCPQRNVNGFYHAAKVVIPAASSWTFARGVEFKAKQAGVR